MEGGGIFVEHFSPVPHRVLLILYSKMIYVYLFPAKSKSRICQNYNKKKTPNKWHSSYSIGNMMGMPNMNRLVLPTIFFIQCL